jgi:hypothetical protein
MNSYINIIFTKIKLKLIEAFNNTENRFKLDVEINNCFDSANVNGTLFINYNGEKISENLIKNNKVFFLKRLVNIEVIGVIKEINKNRINDYVDFIINTISGLKTAEYTGQNYILPSAVNIIEPDEYENYRFKISFVCPVDFNFKGENTDANN